MDSQVVTESVDSRVVTSEFTYSDAKTRSHVILMDDVSPPKTSSDSENTDAANESSLKILVESGHGDNFPVDELFRPGLPDRLSQVEIMKGASKLYGTKHGPCYVTLQDVSIKGRVDVSSVDFPTVGTSILGLIHTLTLRSKPVCKNDILSDVTTAFAPGKLCLLIGAPQSGKSTLLKLIANRQESGLEQSGNICFNGVHPNSKIMPRIAAYTPQYDDHTPVLTVKETLDFAFDCASSTLMQEVAERNGMKLSEAKGQDVNPRNKVDLLLHYFGLSHVKDTVAGSGVLRGLSGGERRRLTIAEQLVGNNMVHCMDEITTGLDSAAAIDIIRTLRNACQVMNNTTIISLLQPPPDVLEMFDEIMVLGAHGTLLYHGPREQAKEYFCKELGFCCPQNMSLADFLVYVSTGDSAEFWSQPGVKPPSCMEIAERWKRSQLHHTYIHPRFAAAASLARDVNENPINRAPWTRPYGASMGTLIKACLRRAIAVKLKNVGILKGLVIQRTIQSVIIGTIFWQLPTTRYNLKVPLFFLLVSILSMSNMYIIDVTEAKRPIFYKHRDSGFFPTWVYVLSEAIADFPMQFIEVLIVSLIVFFFVGLQASTWPVFAVSLICIYLAFGAVYKAFAALAKTTSGSHGMAIGFAALAMCFSGYIVTRSTIPPFFIWIYWIVPTPWIIRIVALNEFKASGKNGYYDQLGQGGVRRGDLMLDAFAIQTQDYWIGYGFLYVLILIVLGHWLYIWALDRLRYGFQRPTVVKKSKSLKISPIGHAKLDPEMLDEMEQSAAAFISQQAFTTLESLSCQPPKVSLVVKDLTYTVTIKAPKESGVKTLDKVLINNVDALFLPGTITALMGASGAGKTTLMDVIAGRKTSGKITGDILVNGHPQDLNTFARISGYVEQMDIHIATLTVIEALRFSANHRLPPELTASEREQVVQAVVDLVELRPIVDKMIGDSSTGLSTEQRKRVTIGVEMAANPSIIFLDEPTSGLDARSAKVVMSVIRRIAAAGRTVVCTVHQPSPEIFAMFDNLLLLKKGGWTVYNGDLGPQSTDPESMLPISSARNMIQYFENLSPTVPRYEQGTNPAEYMLDVIGAGIDTASRSVDVDFVQSYRNSSMSSLLMSNISKAGQGEKVTFTSRYATSFTTQLYYSCRRWFSMYYRNVGYNYNRLIVVLIVALLFSLNVTHLSLQSVSDQATLQSFNGVIFAGVFFTSAVQNSMSVGVIGNSKLVYYKELAAGMYAPFSYIFGATVAEIPWLVLVVGLHLLVFYPLAGLWAATDYVVMYGLAMFLFVMVFCFWGQMISALASTTQAASLIASPTIGLMVLFCGFFIPGYMIPYPWKIFYYIFPARYGLIAAMPKQFYCSLSCIPERQVSENLLRINCADPSIKSLADAPYFGSGPGCSLLYDMTNATAGAQGIEFVQANFPGEAFPRMTVWDYWSSTTHSNINDVPLFLWVSAIFAIGYRVITFLSLKYLRQIKR